MTFLFICIGVLIIMFVVPILVMMHRAKVEVDAEMRIDQELQRRYEKSVKASRIKYADKIIEECLRIESE